MAAEELLPPAPADRSMSDASQGRRIGSGLIWSQVGRVFDIGLGLAFSVLVVRTLGPQAYGAYAVVWSVINVAALVASAGYSEVLTRYLPELNLRDRSAGAALARRLLQERVVISLIVALVVWVLSAPLAIWTHTPSLVQFTILMGALLLAQGVWEFLAAYYAANLRMRGQAAVRLTGQITGLAIALVWFAISGIAIWVPLIAMLGNYLVCIGLYLVGMRESLVLPGKPAALHAIRRFGGYVWLTNLATFGLASQVDVLLIATLLADATQVSYYNVAAVILARLYTVLMGWTGILMPAAAEVRAQSGKRGLARIFGLFMKVNLALVVPTFVFLIAWGQALIVTLFGSAFALSGALLVIFGLFNLASALVGANVCHPLLYVADRQRALLGIRIFAGSLNIVLDVLLIPHLGAAGAVIGTSISNLVTHATEFWLLYGAARFSYPVAMAAKVFGASLLAVLPALLIPGTGWINLILGAVLFAGIFGAMIWWLRPLTPGDQADLALTFPRFEPVLRWLTGV